MLECSKLLKNLDFDKPMKMEGSLAEKYFQENRKEFGVWMIEGNANATSAEMKKGLEFMLDTQKNKIYLIKDFSIVNSGKLNNDAWINKSKTERATILESVATKIGENIELIAQIEYFMRGIPIHDTKEDVKELVEYYRYYANYIYLLKEENSFSKDIQVLLLKDTTRILMFGSVAGNLSAGGRVSLFAQRNVAVLVMLLAKLCLEAGLPPGLIHVYPFQNLKGIESALTDFIPLNSTGNYIEGTTMGVFESSDIDSAVDTIVSTTWSHNGLLRWGFKRILIQESVYNIFTNKLGSKIKELKWNLPSEYVPSDAIKLMIDRVNEIVQTSDMQGIKHIEMNAHFYLEKNKDILKPVILLDNESPNFWCNLSGEYPISIVTTQAFRTSKEFLSMIYKIPTWGLSIWCNNISICNEIALATKIYNVWINTFGFLSPEVSIKPVENMSLFMGGKEGLLMYLKPKTVPDPIFINKRKFVCNEANTLDLKGAIDKVTKLQASWSQTSKEKRISTLQKLALFLENNKKDYIDLQSSEFELTAEDSTNIINASIKYLKSAISFCDKLDNQTFVRNDKRICTVLKEAIGLICIEELKNQMHYFTYSVVVATLFKNGILYKTNSKLIIRACKDFSNMGLPVVPIPEKAVLNNYEAIDVIWKISEIDNNDSWSHKYEDFVSLVHDEYYATMKFCKPKNIWSTYGETFAN